MATLNSWYSVPLEGRKRTGREIGGRIGGHDNGHELFRCAAPEQVFAALVRVFNLSLSSVETHWYGIVWALAVVTMIVGNVIALSQTSMKRLLASQQAETKRLSEEVANLNESIDGLRQSFASVRTTEAETPSVTRRKPARHQASVRKRGKSRG